MGAWGGGGEEGGEGAGGEGRRSAVTESRRPARPRPGSGSSERAEAGACGSGVRVLPAAGARAAGRRSSARSRPRSRRPSPPAPAMEPSHKDAETAAAAADPRAAAASGVVVQVREKKGPLRAAIPYMPFPVAVICLFLNTFVPGLGKAGRGGGVRGAGGAGAPPAGGGAWRGAWRARRPRPASHLLPPVNGAVRPEEPQTLPGCWSPRAAPDPLSRRPETLPLRSPRTPFSQGPGTGRRRAGGHAWRRPRPGSRRSREKAAAGSGGGGRGGGARVTRHPLTCLRRRDSASSPAGRRGDGMVSSDTCGLVCF